MGIVTWAQNFEDVMLWRLFSSQAQGFYVDVGAWHPDQLSVTKWFYEHGWRGINIDPRSDTAALFAARRPADKNLQMAIGQIPGEMPLFECAEHTALSTCSAEQAARLRNKGYTLKESAVPVRTLTSVLDQFAPGRIDFLKIDVEGGEDDVIRSLDLRRHRPTCIVIEATLPESNPMWVDNLDSIMAHAGWEPELLANEYFFVYFDGLNRWYLPNERKDLARFFRCPPGIFDDITFGPVNERLAAQAQENSQLKARAAGMWRLLKGIQADMDGVAERLSRLPLDIGDDQSASAEVAHEASAVAVVVSPKFLHRTWASLSEAEKAEVDEAAFQPENLSLDIKSHLASDKCGKAEQIAEHGDIDAAGILLMEALAVSPDDPRALNDLGAILWGAGERLAAITYFIKATAANPADATAAMNCADALAAVGREGDAKAVLLRHLEAAPDQSDALPQYLALGENSPGALDMAVPRTPLSASAENFAEFTYSRRSLFERLGLPPGHASEDIDDCDLKVFQDMLTYRFILDNFAPGARLLEIGGGDSRIIRWLKDRYEFWNLDKLEGAGNGLTDLAETDGFQLVRDYIGNFSEALPANYFDGVFSLSTLEHVPETEICYKNILADIERVLKPGGLSAHAFDVVVKRKGYWTNGFLPYILSHVPLLHQAVPFWKMRLDPETWTMSRRAYERLWQPVTGKSWEEFGKPLSYNVCWRKPAAATSGDSLSEGAVAVQSTSKATSAASSSDGIKASAASDTFCVLPWIHLQFNPEGSVKVCCRAGDSLVDTEGVVLTPYSHSMNEIWGSDALKQVRLAMMEGRQVGSCAGCYEQEKSGQSYRIFSNQRWAAEFGLSVDQLQQQIRANGVEKGMDLAFLQLNLGNLCNLKCRICSSSHSSQIERDPVHSKWRPHTLGNLKGIEVQGQGGVFRFGVAGPSGMRFDGFHPGEFQEEIFCRWTNGHGVMSCAEPFPDRPHRVVLRVLAYRPFASHGTSPVPLQVIINGTEAYNDLVARGVSEIAIDVPPGSGCRLSVELISPTYERNGRNSGVGLLGVEVHTEHASSKGRPLVRPLVSRLAPGESWHDSDAFVFGDLIADTGSLKELYFTGGEPFINRQVRKILSTLIERRDNNRIALQFNSNFTSVDDALLDVLSKFNKVSIAASVDAAGTFYEYIRYPAKWERVAANIRKMQGLRHVRLTFVPIISAYNVMNIVELCRYCDGINVDFVLCDLGGERDIDLCVLPPSARGIASRRLREYADGDCRPHSRPTVLRLAERLDNELFDPARLVDFIEFTNDLDAGRRVDFRQQHAELCDLMARDGYRWDLRKRFA